MRALVRICRVLIATLESIPPLSLRRVPIVLPGNMLLQPAHLHARSAKLARLYLDRAIRTVMPAPRARSLHLRG